MGFSPFEGRGFETFIRRDLIVRVCILKHAPSDRPINQELELRTRPRLR
jgi:hypothetical protein